MLYDDNMYAKLWDNVKGIDNPEKQTNNVVKEIIETDMRNI